MQKRQLRLCSIEGLGRLFARIAYCVFSAAASTHAADFSANEPGVLRAQTGIGTSDTTIYAPQIRFPLEHAPAYLNSQVYSLGGYWSHPINYQYPWWDNFCESRQWTTPMCPSGKGHQGQDIRPADKRKGVHWAVAVEDGQIVYVSPKPGYVLRLRGARTGNLYNYLHLDMARLSVKRGDRVSAGDRLGLVSNDFGGTPTSVHLHFEVLQAQKGQAGLLHVPPYTSLVEAYKKELAK